MNNDEKIKELTAKINKIANKGIDQTIQLAIARARLTSDSLLIIKEEMLEMVAPFKHNESAKDGDIIMEMIL